MITNKKIVEKALYYKNIHFKISLISGTGSLQDCPPIYLKDESHFNFKSEKCFSNYSTSNAVVLLDGLCCSVTDMIMMKICSAEECTMLKNMYMKNMVTKKQKNKHMI